MVEEAAAAAGGKRKREAKLIPCRRK